MTISAKAAYLAELRGMKLLAELPRPRVSVAVEFIDGALSLWNTRGTGSHVDNIRLDPDKDLDITHLFHAVQRSTLRVPGGSVFIRGLKGMIKEHDQEVLEQLTSRQASTGYLMARSLEGIQQTSSLPQLHSGSTIRVGVPESTDEYLAIRKLVDGIFRGEERAYDPETDFYHGPSIMTTIAAWEEGEVIAGASILIVNGIANIWSVATRASARNRGMASIVTHASLVEAARLGAHAASLGTSQSLARPNGLYNRLGFEIVGHEIGWMISNVDEINLDSVSR